MITCLVSLPAGEKGWTREMEFPAVPRVGENVEIEGNEERTVKDVLWRLNDSPYIILEPWPHDLEP